MPLPAAWLWEGNSVLFLNSSFCHFTGAPESLHKHELLKWVHPADAEHLRKLLKDNSQEEEKIYIRLRNQDGDYRWHCHSWKPMQEEGKPPGILSLFQDIHDFYQQKPQLVNRFQKIFNETLQFISLLDREGRLIEVNKSALDFGGYKMENIRGEYLWRAGWWKNTPETDEKFHQAVKTTLQGNLFRSEETIFGLGNRKLVIDFSLKPIFSENGQVKHLIAEGRDITDLKRVKDQLRIAEKSWRTLVENTPDVIVRHNASFEFIYASSAIEKLTGLPPSQFIGKLPEQVALSPATVRLYTEYLHKAFQQKKRLSYSTELQTGNKKAILFTTVTPEVNEQGEVKSLLVSIRDISELKDKEKQLAKANKELMLSGAKLRNILDSTKELICARDLNLRLLAFNKAFEEDYFQIYGKRPKVGESIEEQLAHIPQEKNNLLALWQRAIQGEEYTIQHDFGDGSRPRKHYEITYSSILDQEGNIIGATAISRDLTKELKFEKELKDAREFLILSENLPQIVFTTGPNGIPDYLNQAFYEYTGIEELDFDTPFGEQFIHPIDLEALLLTWKAAVDQQEGLQQELRLRYKTGEYRWNLIRFLPLVNPQGNLVKWIGSATDIHEGKTSEEQQRLAALEFRQLSESLPQIIWTAAPDGTFNYLNDKWYEYTGEPQENAFGMGWLDFIHPDDQEAAAISWNYAIKNEEEFLIEYRLQNMNGQYRWFLGKALPLHNSDDEVVKWFGSATDIHDQKLQNKRLLQQNHQLNQINQYLDNFVHTAAHDLRAPIVNIKGLLSLLEDISEEKKDQIIHNLKISTDRLDSTLQGMIQLIEAQSQTGDLSRNINVKEVFMEIFADFKEELAQVDYELKTDFSECFYLNFVLPYIKSIFRNLISNSIKYRKPNEKLVLHVKCQQQDDFLIITYKDNGIGIDLQRYGKNLFRPFRRFTSQATGKGIGMHIVKNMMVKTGGNIKVESELGKGTTFKLYLKNQPEIREEDLLFPDEV